MAQNGRKMAIYELYISSFFLQNWKLKGRKTIVISVTAFDPIKILTRLVFQNDPSEPHFSESY